ncbi:MAG: cation:proton antiporter [Oscillospiraceae bacterium]
MQTYNYLLALAIILLSTKIFSLASKKVNMPQVLGALIAGLVLGPSVLGMISESDFIIQTSEIGVIMLMFIAGLDTDLKELKSTGIASAVIAMLGVILPLGGGYLIYNAFFYDVTDELGMLRAIFIGIVLTATSVSITVETLREIGKLNGKVGTAIVGAALIDDILGIIILTITTSFTDKSTKLSVSLGKILLFFVFLAIVGTLVHFLFIWLEKRHGQKRRIAVYAFSFCLFMAYSAVTWFGVADIAGAYFAGLFLCNIDKTKSYISDKLNIASYMLFSPVFFASIGIMTDLRGMSKEIILFSLALLIVAIVTKIVGCGVGARICKFTNKESFDVGLGMVTRGEVALVVARKGAQAGLVSESLFPAVILIVIATSLLTPIFLKLSMNSKHDKTLPATFTEESPDNKNKIYNDFKQDPLEIDDSKDK